MSSFSTDLEQSYHKLLERLDEPQKFTRNTERNEPFTLESPNSKTLRSDLLHPHQPLVSGFIKNVRQQEESLLWKSGDAIRELVQYFIETPTTDFRKLWDLQTKMNRVWQNKSPFDEASKQNKLFAAPELVAHS